MPLETVVFEYGAHLDRKAHVVFHTNDLCGLTRFESLEVVAARGYVEHRS